MRAQGGQVRLRGPIPREPEAETIRHQAASMHELSLTPAEEKPEVPSLGKFAEAWLEERRAVLTLATAYDYDRLIKALLIPSPLAQKRIDEVNDGDVHLFMGEMSRRKTRSGQPVGPRRINMIIARLRTIFATADVVSWFPKTRCCSSRIFANRRQRLIRSSWKRRSGETNSATGQDRAIITVLILVRSDSNEALALRWQDVDFGRRILKIRRTIHRFGGIGLPKTASSERDVDTLDPVIVELEEQRARTQMRGELVFLNDVGGPVDLTNFRDRNWKRILIRARLRARTIYQCRHTFAALQLSRGENPQYVAHQMGHTNLEMIIRHYARWSRKPDSALAL